MKKAAKRESREQLVVVQEKDLASASGADSIIWWFAGPGPDPTPPPGGGQ